jgi:hypothetical protein
MKKLLTGALVGLLVVMTATFGAGPALQERPGRHVVRHRCHGQDQLLQHDAGRAALGQRSGRGDARLASRRDRDVLSLQSPAAVAQGTTAEQTLTIQTGTGGTMLLAAGDLVYVNKPTSQAGLGVGNVRVSSGNTLGITFINVPAGGGNITPTASQAYSGGGAARRGHVQADGDAEPCHRWRPTPPPSSSSP